MTPQAASEPALASDLGTQAPPVCRLSDMRCRFCGSRLVQIVEAMCADRVICPICLAIGELSAVAAEPGMLKRGTPIDRQLRYLVDRARFPQREGHRSGSSHPGPSDAGSSIPGRPAKS